MWKSLAATSSVTSLPQSMPADGMVTRNVNRWFGITGDVSGSYKNGGHMYTYMVGPTLSARTERVTPFAHALFGGASAGGLALVPFRRRNG